MPRTPSNAELRALILDLCRASVLLRIVERRDVISGGGSERLAEAIDAWLIECESQITPILETQDAPADTNVISFVPRGAARVEPEAPVKAPRREPPRSPSAERLQELRRQLQIIAQAIPKI